MLLRLCALCRRGRCDDEGAVPLSRMPIYQRRRAQCVRGHAGRWLQLHQGSPRQFARKDLERAVTREFCAECGTHLVTRMPGLPLAALKVGTFDDPSLGQPQLAIYTIDKQVFHQIPRGHAGVRAAAAAVARNSQNPLPKLWWRSRRERGFTVASGARIKWRRWFIAS